MLSLTRCGAAALSLSSLGLLVVAGCSTHFARKPAAEVVAAVPVGNAVCGECHASEYHAHSVSRHARTMTPMTPEALGPLAPPIGPVTPQGPVLESTGQGYALARAKDHNATRKLDLVLGSGKTGMTYVAIVDKWRVAEVHMSYFPSLKWWTVTPGQEDMPETSFGRTYPTDVSAKCIHCHSVRAGESSLQPANEFMGVGCESCHGPGSAHVSAMRAGRTNDLHMENIGSWGADRINALCGQCHRTAMDLSRPEDYMATNRFAAYGLMLSQCYQQSHNTLSCITCHDPHTDASTDPQKYVADCLRCHSSVNTRDSAAPHNTILGKPCKVNPISKCLDCHMPRRPVFHGVPVSMRDHYIRVNPPGSL